VISAMNTVFYPEILLAISFLLDTQAPK